MKPYIPSTIAWGLTIAAIAALQSACGTPQINTLRHDYAILFRTILLASILCQFVSMFWGIIGVSSRPSQRRDFIILLALSCSSWLGILMLLAYLAE